MNNFSELFCVIRETLLKWWKRQKLWSQWIHYMSTMYFLFTAITYNIDKRIAMILLLLCFARIIKHIISARSKQTTAMVSFLLVSFWELIGNFITYRKV